MSEQPKKSSAAKPRAPQIAALLAPTKSARPVRHKQPEQQEPVPPAPTDVPAASTEKPKSHSRPRRATADKPAAINVPLIPDAWQVAIYLLEHGGVMPTAQIFAAFPALVEVSGKRQQTLLLQWCRQHLFTQSADGFVLTADPALSLRRLFKYTAIRQNTPSDAANQTQTKRPRSSKATPPPAAEAALMGQMAWRLVPPITPAPMQQEPLEPAKTQHRQAKKAPKSTPAVNPSAPPPAAEALTFAADSRFPFLLGDKVLGVTRRNVKPSRYAGKSTRKPAADSALEMMFEPLYLVERQQKTLTAYLINDQTLKVSLVLGRKQWLMPVTNGRDIPKALLQRQGLVEVAILPEQGLIHEAEARFIREVTDVDPESLTAILEHHLPHQFSDEVLAQCQTMQIPALAPSDDAPVKREDLRDLPLITIDGEDAKDFDDAVWAKAVGAGSFQLIVAIADVSHYVREGTALDEAAFERSTSVYFPRRVVPMLPPALSENLCSLRPDEDRAVLCAEMTINAQGDLVAHRFFPALIRSQARLTYHEVETLIFADGAKPSSAKAKRPKAVLDNLHALKQVYQALAQARGRRGALELDSREWKFRFDGGRVVEVFQADRLEAHRLIEECMIAANVCAATFLAACREPLLYRVHELPLPEKVALLHQNMIAQGIAWQPSEPISPQSLSQLLQQIRADQQLGADDEASRARYDMLQMAVLRTLKQAQYTPQNDGHFGLGLSHYAHFTSPIRRYPDLLVHRGIMKALTRALPQQQQPTNSPALKQDWGWLGLYCTQAEKRADEASRAAAGQLRCELTVPLLGQRVEGLITGVAAFGLFVQLPISMADGMLGMRTLGNALGEYLEYSAEQQRIIAPRSQKSFGVGERIHVVVQAVLPQQRKIELGV